MTPSQELIEQECYFIRDLLLEKNRKYGDSAINPVRIFSQADAVEQINVRIDDKLSRISSAKADDHEDAELDLIGYLILKRVAQRSVRIVEHLTSRIDREAQQAAATLMPNIATEDDEWQPLPCMHGLQVADDPAPIDGQQIDHQLRRAHKVEETILTMGNLCRSRRDQAVRGVNA